MTENEAFLDLLAELAHDSTRANPTLIEDACRKARETILTLEADRVNLLSALRVIQTDAASPRIAGMARSVVDEVDDEEGEQDD